MFFYSCDILLSKDTRLKVAGTLEVWYLKSEVFLLLMSIVLGRIKVSLSGL